MAGGVAGGLPQLFVTQNYVTGGRKATSQIDDSVFQSNLRRELSSLCHEGA